jgi:HEXXH motif-containing protein
MATRLSRHLLQIRALREALQGNTELDMASGFADNYTTLARLQQKYPAAVAKVMTDPDVGSWSAHCLRLLAQQQQIGESLANDLSFLGAVVLSVATEVGTAASAHVSVHDGWTYLPGLGSLHSGLTASTSELSVNEHGVFIPSRIPARSSGEHIAEWRPIWQIDLQAQGQSLSLTVDDLSPYRHHLGPPSPRLEQAEFAHWQWQLQLAWQILSADHPNWAHVLAGLVSKIVPLQTQESGVGNSATSRSAVGKVALTTPDNGLLLAATLIHEAQHNRLYAIQDLHQLCRQSTAQLHYSPWRDDPRPVEGLLHGAFAFAGVADYWREQSRSDNGHAQTASATFAVALQQVRNGYEELNRNLAAFTAKGQSIVDDIGAVVRLWEREPVDEAVSRRASQVTRTHEILWRIRNLRPDMQSASKLARAFPYPPANPVRIAAPVLRPEPGTSAVDALPESLRAILARGVSAPELAWAIHQQLPQPVDSDVFSDWIRQYVEPVTRKSDLSGPWEFR